MSEKRIRQIERQIGRIKEALQDIGPMRPGSLTCQYRAPKEQAGPYWQISYTHRMKSHTNYVRAEFLTDIRKQIANYKRFKRFVEQWVNLAIEHSQLTMRIAKTRTSR